MADDERTHYQVLGLDRRIADERSIRRAYMKASLLHHPDKNPDDVEGAQARFVEVGRAYEVLRDPELRREYDRELDSGGGAAAAARRRRQRHGRGGGGGGSDGTNGGGGSKGFQKYSDAFESFVAGMSEDELNAAVGAASAVGSVVGSVLGSRFARKASTRGSAIGSAAASASSLAGSAAASRAAAELVRSVHERSVERATYEERRRAAVERGEEPPPEPGRSVLEGLIGRAVEATTTRSDRGGASSSKMSDSSGSSKWKSVLGTAVHVAGAVAALNEAKSTRSRNGQN